MAAVKRRFPAIRQPKQQDICYATQNRQDAVKLLAPGVDVLIVVGSPSSSNSNRLRELAERLGADAYMVDTADDLRPEWFEGKRRVGLTAGASAPEVLVEAVVARLRALGAVSVRSVAGHARARPLPAADGPRRQGDARGAELAFAGAPCRRSARQAAMEGDRRDRRRRLRLAAVAPLSQPSQAQPALAASACLRSGAASARGSGQASSGARDRAARRRRREDPRRAKRAGDDEQGDDEGLGHGQPASASVTR